MIGTLREEVKSATIVGAGISGLLIGAVLKKRGWRVRILEASSRAGGLIETRNTPSGPVEAAAHSLMITPELKTFFDELGIELSPVDPRSRARYIFRDGRMRRFPLTLRETLFTLWRFLTGPGHAVDPETASVSEWCESYLGRPALDFLLTPFVAGIFAASPDELLLKSAFPRLLPRNPRHSLFRQIFLEKRAGKKAARPVMMAPTLGMEEVIRKLSGDLKSEIEFQSEIHSIPDTGNVILTLPAGPLATLLKESDPESSEALSSVSYSPLITCTVFVRDEYFPNGAPRGVGVLIPRAQGPRILGVLFNSSAFPGRSLKPGLSSYTVMLGGTSDPGALLLSDLEIRQTLERDLWKVLRLSGPIESLEITRWPRAIPVYSRSLERARKLLISGFCATPGRMVFSNYSKDVSIRGLIQSLISG